MYTGKMISKEMSEMRATQSLPENYEQIYTIDLQKDKKKALLINALSLLIAAVLIIPVAFIKPFDALFDKSRGQDAYFLRFAVMLAACIFYLVLHELVHGIAMKLCGTKKVRYGATGLYAYAGSDDYYGKKAYVFIALAPVVLWGIVLAVVCCLVPDEWFWVVYLVQIANLSGAAGDLFVTVRFSRMPSDILVRDYGVSMCVYAKKTGE